MGPSTARLKGSFHVSYESVRVQKDFYQSVTESYSEAEKGTKYRRKDNELHESGRRVKPFTRNEKVREESDVEKTLQPVTVRGIVITDEGKYRLDNGLHSVCELNLPFEDSGLRNSWCIRHFTNHTNYVGSHFGVSSEEIFRVPPDRCLYRRRKPIREL